MKADKPISLPDVIEILRAECAKAGGQKAWAATVGVSPQFVGDVIRGRREPGPKLLAPLGLDRVVTYRRIPRCQ